MEPIYIEHSAMFFSDSAESNDAVGLWTADHERQGYAKRSRKVVVATIFAEDGLIREITDDEARLDECTRVLEVSLECGSGVLHLSGTSTGDFTVWTGRPGWIRLVIGQLPGADETLPSMTLVLHVHEANGPEPTRAWVDGEELPGPFIETTDTQPA